MYFCHKSRRTNAEYNGDENRNRGPLTWSNCRKRVADGSMRSNGDMDSTSDLKKNNATHRHSDIRPVSTALVRMVLQRVVRTVQYITGAELPAIQDLYIKRCEKKARKIVRPQPPKP